MSDERPEPLSDESEEESLRLAEALFFASGILSTGPVLMQLTMGALMTAAGSLLALGAARVLRVGRFAH